MLNSDKEDLVNLTIGEGAQYSRLVGYLVVVSIYVVGITAGVYPNEYILLAIAAAIIPMLHNAYTNWASKGFLANHIAGSIVIIDAFCLGIGISSVSYSVLPSISMIGVTLPHILGIGSSSIILIGAFSTLLASVIGGLLFGFHFSTYSEMPAAVAFVCVIGLSTSLCLMIFFSSSHARKLIFAKNILLEQQKNTILLSRKLIKYLPPQVWESIFSGKKDTKLQNQRKKLTVFFSDIKDFTETTDEMPPDVLTEMLNFYFDQMSKIALKHGGTIDKFIGDAILIFFGDPSSKGSKEDALACVSMAIDMRKMMQVLRQKWLTLGIEKPLHIRMGITTGYCHVGNFGSESRMDYTIIGRDANLASRLQNVADPDEILISNDTYLLVRDRIMCKEKGSVRLRGIADPINVWQVVDFRSDVGSEPTWLEHEYEGFAMLMDLNKINTYDKERIVKALETAATRIKKRPLS
jgi:adenylate cyclase